MVDKLSPAYFVQFLGKNVDNSDLTDEQFRRFVRDNLSMVTGSGYAPEQEKITRIENSISELENWFIQRIQEASVDSFNDIRRALQQKVSQLESTVEAYGLTSDNKTRIIARISELRTTILSYMAEKLKQSWIEDNEKPAEPTFPKSKSLDEVLAEIGQRLNTRLSREDVSALKKYYTEVFRRPGH